MREVERRHAASSVAEAQGAHGKLVQLYTRSGAIAASHAARADAGDGGDLARQLGFMAGLTAIMHDTRRAEDEAALAVERALLRLREADRRRERVSERLGEERRAADRSNLAKESAASAILARKLKGS